ncbi:hypothetical protein MYU51_020419 [Penicillium brevicompactum]
MSVNNASNSKAPAGDAEIRQKRLINVQPLRPNELQPKYAQRIQHDLNDPDAHGWFAGLIHSMGACIGYCGAIPCCICYPNPFEPVEQGAVDLVSRLGRFERWVDPGLVKVNLLSEHITTVDVKIQIVETSSTYYEVVSPHKATFGITNVRRVEHTQTTLRHVIHLIGARVLQDVIERREEIAQSTSEIIEEVAAGWGVKVESMLIKDIFFQP